MIGIAGWFARCDRIVLRPHREDFATVKTSLGNRSTELSIVGIR